MSITMPVFFSFNLSISTIALLAVAVATALTYIVWQATRSARLRRFISQDQAQRHYAVTPPPISVIVDACGETDQLARFLPLVLSQEYDAEFEVIVIVNSAAEATSDMLSEMKAEHPNLHFTFAPYSTRTLSRKKLAIMIGIKAAQYDIVLTTNATCRPAGNQWLATIGRNFVDGTDIVLGYSHYEYDLDHRAGRRMRIFDSVATATQWTLSAIRNKPYRGTSDNLAYRKQLFFDNNGFAESMNLIWGEDDVFISQIANAYNTRLELAPESQLSVHYENLPRTHRLLKMRRDFTSRFIRRAPFRTQALMSLLWWLAPICLLAAIALNPTNLAVTAIAAAVILFIWPLASWAFNGAFTTLQAPRLWFTAPLLALWRPLLNIVYHLRESRQTKSHYTSYL